MSTISLRTNHSNDVTVISNIFIDNYMPNANGAYVKVYLYLLRCLSSQNFELSISNIADHLDDTEKDILRAISYWEKVKLIAVTRTSDNQITNITFNNPSQMSDNSSLMHSSLKQDVDLIPSSFGNEAKPLKEFSKPTYTRAQIEELSKENDVKLIMGAVESYLQRPLKSTDQQLILYLYESIGFSSDLIMYLYEYCVSMNKKSSSYIEAVALAWANEGIDSEEKAKQYTTTYNKSYHAISRAFGLNRSPGDIEIQYINKWQSSLSLPLEIIVEACNRSLLRTGKPDFKYADRILENWAKQHVKNMSDIKRLDDAHAKQAQTAPPSKNVPAQKNTNNRFNNFTQRNYTKEDFKKMEQLLLNKR